MVSNVVSANLSKDELYDLLMEVKPEATAVSRLIDEATTLTDRIDELKSTSVTELVPISTGIVIAGLIFYFVPGVLYLIYKNAKRAQMSKEVKKEIKELEAKVADLNTRAKAIADNFRHLTKLPKKYRHALAVNTMLEFMENGRASTWSELADKYEEQEHRWRLESTAQDALEYQKYTALLTQQTASSASAAAGFAALGAAASIANLFW